MKYNNSRSLKGKQRGSGLRIFIILVTLIPAWHWTAMDRYNLAQSKGLAISLAFDKSRELPYPSYPIEFQATAYCESGITKSGLKAAKGLVAADPSVLPLGSWIHVECPLYRGIYQVMDTGRLVKGRIIDIYLPELRQATEFGRQRIQVTVLKYGRNKRKPLNLSD